MIELMLATAAAETSVGGERAAPPARAGVISAVQAALIAAPQGPVEERPVPASPAALSAEPLPVQDTASVAAQDEDAAASEAAVVAGSAGPPGGSTGPSAAIGSAGPVGPSGSAGGTGAGTGDAAVEATTRGGAASFP